MFQLYNEDCLVGLKKLPKKSIDIICCSPPLNLGFKYSTYDDSISRTEYLKWMGRWARLTHEILKDDGSIFLNMGSKPSDPWGPLEVALEMKQQQWKLQNTIHWIKSIALGWDEDSITIGHFKPINSGRFLNDCHEYIFHFSKNSDIKLNRLAIGAAYTDKKNIERWKSKNLKHCRGNNWLIPYKTIQNNAEERPHPATYPPELALKCILLHGIKEKMIVCDPFMGLGNTGEACHQLKIDFIGFEIDTNYFNYAKERLN